MEDVIDVKAQAADLPQDIEVDLCGSNINRIPSHAVFCLSCDLPVALYAKLPQCIYIVTRSFQFLVLCHLCVGYPSPPAKICPL
eukprot:TRINITY_DN5448_c0_g1_i1.p2 TRINITY_DN5448_c0_g1~~TRINITY_DN5448_c0_g1_i1.p2  ORF type:complete len:84 (+),score=10.64 TRINITY_DN5448_c0_g1_i1:158-409(+)